MTFGASHPTRRALVSTRWKRLCPSIKRRDGYRCSVCRVAEVFHVTAKGRRLSNLVVGHKIPPERYAGGHNDPANLWTLCSSCNASQGNRTPEEWRAARSGRLVDLQRTGKTPTPSSVITKDYS